MRMKALVSIPVVIIFAMSMRVPCVFGLDVRLIGGPDRYSGRVEVRHNGVWGTVCDDGWDTRDAQVVCRMLGFKNASKATGYASYGEGSGSIFLDNVKCIGLETDLGECSHNGLEVHDCQHTEDAGAVCSNKDPDLQVRLVGGPTAYKGRVEVFFEGSWGTVCDDAWDLNDVRVVCRMLGFQSAVRAVSSAGYGEGSGSIILDDVECLGTERNLAECSHNGYENHNCGHSEDAGAVCANVRLPESPPLEVRLVDGPNPREGRVEVLYEGSWGTICDDYWDSNDAKVVCRMLGFNRALSAPRGSAYGQGSGPILLDDVACVGTENNLADCSHSDLGVHNCDHTEDAAAVCSIEDTTIENFGVRLVNGRSRNEGRVEVFYKTTWGTLCGVGWDLREADVVCRMLGFTDASDVLHNATFGEGVGMVFLEGISCLGSENILTDCAFIYFEANSCRHSQDVGVKCKYAGALISTTKLNPTTSLGHTEHVSQSTTFNLESSARDSRTLSLAGALISTTKLNPTTSMGHTEHVSQSTTVNLESSAGDSRTLSLAGALISTTKLNPTTSLGHTEHVCQCPTVNSVSLTSRALSPVSIVLGAILAASYVLFLLLGLYGCHRLRKLERMTDKDLSEQPTSKVTGSSKAASAYPNLASPSRKSTETPGKEAPGELQYMNLEVPENTIGGDRVYTELSFTKGSEQEGPSRKCKTPIKPPVGRKPKFGRLGFPDRIDPSPLTHHDPIYDDCE